LAATNSDGGGWPWLLPGAPHQHWFSAPDCNVLYRVKSRTEEVGGGSLSAITVGAELAVVVNRAMEMAEASAAKETIFVRLRMLREKCFEENISERLIEEKLNGLS
jgi:hypothetical protein